MNRKALGRGISSLIREVEPTEHAADIRRIPAADIDPSPVQPRHGIPEASLKELAESIRSTGIIQPVVVRRSGERFQLVAGERRWRAARLAGLAELPAVVREVSDQGALELALAENLLREDLNPIEAAKAYSVLQQRFGLSQEQIASQLGIDRTTVTNTIRLLRLPEPVQRMVEKGDLAAGHARALLGLPSSQAQQAAADEILKRGLSVRQAEKLVAKRDETGKIRADSAAADKATVVDANVQSAEAEMQRVLGTRVRIIGDSSRGKIEIHYFSGEDLNRVYALVVSGKMDR